MTRTKTQNARLHWLIGQLNIDAENKQQLVYDYTKGRSTSSKDLTAKEAAALIAALEQMLAPPRKDTPHPQTPSPAGEGAVPLPSRGGARGGATNWTPPGGRALNQLRRYLMSLAINAGYYTHKNGRVVCDVPALQAWIDQYGAVKKPLNDMTKAEVNKLVRQMEQYAGKEIRKS